MSIFSDLPPKFLQNTLFHKALRRRPYSYRKQLAFLPVFFIFFFQCSLHYDRLIQTTENYFFQGEFDLAIQQVKPLAEGSKKKNRLLYLLEVALIYHTQGNYQKSNELFQQADSLAKEINKKISEEVLAFLLSDQEKSYIGENFERILIKFYIALNSLLLGDLDTAHRYFKKLQFSLKDLKYFDAAYKQNLMARYLTAILAEKFKNYNDARVEYKNINILYKYPKTFLSDQYVLAVKEQDTQDINRYSSGKSKINAYNQRLERVNYNKNMGELIIIHQAGKAMIKKSRGHLRDDVAFMASLYVAVRLAIASKKIAVGVSGIMATLNTAENPVPIYKPHDGRKPWALRLHLNQKDIGDTYVLNDYSQTAIQNFNDNYKKIVNKNVSSIALKAVSVTIAAYATQKGVEHTTGNAETGALAGILVGFLSGSIVGSTIKPDLRCWHLLPSNFQIKRIFLEPGEYNLELEPQNGSRLLNQEYSKKIKIGKGDLLFVSVRTI